MLHSQDSGPFGGRQLTGREVEAMCLYVRAFGCANFQFAEGILLTHFMQQDPETVLSEGTVPAKRLKIDPVDLASAVGSDTSEFERALTALQAGDVLRRDSDGLWRLNPDWREWKYSDGRIRIGPEFRGYMRTNATKVVSGLRKPRLHGGR